MFFPRSALGYGSPVIDPAAVIHLDRFSLDPKAILGNLTWSLLVLIVLWSSAVLLGQLMAGSAALMAQIMRRVPLQILLTLVLIALYRLVVPGAHAQGMAATATGSLLQIPIVAFVFFVVVGLSNTLFNNLLTAEGDRLHAVFHIQSDRILRSVWVILLLSLLYAVIGGYINPGFSILPSRDLGMIFVTLISVLLSAYFKDSLSFLLARRKNIDAWFQGNLAGLLIAIGCVWLTRTFGFDPGYIYGIPAGLVVGAHLSHAEEGRLEAAGMVSGLVIAIVVWLLGSILTGTGVPLDLCNLVFVILAEDAFFDMIPLPTLAGSAIYSWNRGAWALLCIIVTFLLFHTLLNPQGTVSGILGQPPALGAVLLLGCYAVFVLLLWAIVTYRNREE